MTKAVKFNLERLRKVSAAALAISFLLAAAQPSFADDEDHKASGHRHDDDEADYDDALKAVRQGNVLPLGTIMKTIRRRWPGEILNIEVKRRGKNLHYEFKVLRKNGHLTEIEVNAANGTIIEVENE